MNCSAVPVVHRPSIGLLGTEPVRAAMEFVRHTLVKIDASKPGDGHPVVIFPGLGAGASSVATRREHCGSRDYEAFDWGQGLNTGPEGALETWLETLKVQVTDLLAGLDQSATLFGCSLGGLYARELGKLMAPRLRQMITIDTPFHADADHTHVGRLFRLLSGNSTAMGAALSRRLRTPPPVPTMSICSRSDGVVARQTCVHDKPFMRVQDIEVDGSHIGVGRNRDVLDTMTDQLRQRPGSWVGRSQGESAVSLLIQAPLPVPERMPPPPHEVPPPPPLEIPPHGPPEVREPDLPGEHLPISDGPRPTAAATHTVANDVRAGTTC